MCHKYLFIYNNHALLATLSFKIKIDEWKGNAIVDNIKIQIIQQCKLFDAICLLMCISILISNSSIFFFFFHKLMSNLSPGVMGVQHTWLLVHRIAGERCTVPSLVHVWATQGILDHWILQPSRVPHCNETGHSLVVIKSYMTRSFNILPVTFWFWLT